MPAAPSTTRARTHAPPGVPRKVVPTTRSPNILLQKDHLKNEKIATLAGMLGGLSDDATFNLLKAVAEKGPSRKAQV